MAVDADLWIWGDADRWDSRAAACGGRRWVWRMGQGRRPNGVLQGAEEVGSVAAEVGAGSGPNCGENREASFRQSE